jgi:hypothetical protein
MKLADKMRLLTNKVAYNEDSVAVRKAYEIIRQRMEDAASKGKDSLIYPFDGETSSFRDWPHRLNDQQIKTLVKMFEAEGFKYHYAASQDPGHPCDRELHEFTW